LRLRGHVLHMQSMFLLYFHFGMQSVLLPCGTHRTGWIYLWQPLKKKECQTCVGQVRTSTPKKGKHGSLLCKVQTAVGFKTCPNALSNVAYRIRFSLWRELRHLLIAAWACFLHSSIKDLKICCVRGRRIQESSTGSFNRGWSYENKF